MWNCSSLYYSEIINISRGLLTSAIDGAIVSPYKQPSKGHDMTDSKQEAVTLELKQKMDGIKKKMKGLMGAQHV